MTTLLNFAYLLQVRSSGTFKWAFCLSRSFCEAQQTAAASEVQGSPPPFKTAEVYLLDLTITVLTGKKGHAELTFALRPSSFRDTEQFVRHGSQYAALNFSADQQVFFSVV